MQTASRKLTEFNFQTAALQIAIQSLKLVVKSNWTKKKINKIQMSDAKTDSMRIVKNGAICAWNLNHIQKFTTLSTTLPLNSRTICN